MTHFASVTASPIFTPMDTPQMLSPHEGSPYDSPAESRSHTPSLSSFSEQPGGGLLRHGSVDSRRGSLTQGASFNLQNGQAIHYHMQHQIGGPMKELNLESRPGSRTFLDNYKSFLDGNDSVDHSRSESPPPPPTLQGESSVSYSFDALNSFAEILVNGIATSHEIKKKDASGRTFQNCFMGKEAINCLRQRLPKGSNSSEEAGNICQQLLQEGFIIEAQSIEDLNRQIAAKFNQSPEKTVSSAKSSPKLGPVNSLAFKVPANIGGPSVAQLLTFRKDGLYQLSNLCMRSSVVNSVQGSIGGSTANSTCTSPTMGSSPVPSMSHWYANFSGFLGKKRENKGLGNSLALGLGVSTFQKRWFQCSMKEQAVLYFKDDPTSHQGEISFPLGFIPFTEILFVDHLQSSANQLAIQNALTTGLTSTPGGKHKKVLSKSGSATPPLPSAAASAQDEKLGRLFDIVASFRVYHLQADTTMDAMKWVQAIKESIKDCYQKRTDKLLGSTIQANLNSTATGNASYYHSPGTQTLKAPLIRTPRTPELSKRFWSNQTQPNLNPQTFPQQWIKQMVMKGSGQGNESKMNGIYSTKLQPTRLSPLRRYFFDLFFSVSALNQPNHFDAIFEEFDSDLKIIELCWNLIMKGAAKAEETGPKSFKSNVNGANNNVPFISPISQPILVHQSSSTNVMNQGTKYVDWSSSTVLLARMRESEVEEEGDLDDTNTTSSSTYSGSSSTSTRPHHRRAISCSILPDSFRRKVVPPRVVFHIPKPIAMDDIMLEDKSSSEESQSRSKSSRSSSSKSTRGRSRSIHHGRSNSDICPLPVGIITKFRSVDYYLQNKYHLYHAAACKVPNAGSAVSSAPSTLLSPSHLYRIFHPYKRLESWLHTDEFLTLVMNDAVLVNEVPLALPLIWLILQWRNHDSDPHSGSGFVDDSCLKKNWLDESVDGEDDGFKSMNEEDETLMAEHVEEKKKAGFKSVARAHLRVNSFSTMADPLSAIRPSVSQPMAPNSGGHGPSSSPISMGGASPIVYGSHGQIIAGARQGGVPTTPLFAAHAHVTSPTSPSFSDYQSSPSPEGPCTGGLEASPLSPFPLVRSTSEQPHHSAPPLNHHHLHGSPPPTRIHPIPNRTIPMLPPTSPPLLNLQQSPVSPNTPVTRQWGGSIEENRDRGDSNTSEEPGRMKSNSESGGSDSSTNSTGMGSLIAGMSNLSVGGQTMTASAPVTRRNSFVNTLPPKPTLNSVSFATTSTVMNTSTSSTTPNSKRASLEPGQSIYVASSPLKSSMAPPSTPPHHHHHHHAPQGSGTPTTPLQSSRSPPPLPGATGSPPSGSLQLRQRDRATIFQTPSSNSATMRPPNLLQCGGSGYATIRSNTSSGPNSGMSATTIPLDVPHWKVRSLVSCKYCLQSALEFMQAIQERYGMDAGQEEYNRACQVAREQKKPPPKTRPDNKFTIAIANNLFSLLLVPLYTLPSLSGNDFLSTNNPILQDNFNVLGKVILSPHIWPSLIACLQSKYEGKFSADTRLPYSASLQNTFLKHHVLKDLNTLFIGTNLAANNRNCKLLFKFFGFVTRGEYQAQQELALEKEREKKLSEKEREKLERKRRKHPPPTRVLIGSWQTGLLQLLKNHIPTDSIRRNSLSLTQRKLSGTGGADLSVERLHSKIYQYTLNLFGVFHFYKFQCIGSVTPANIQVAGHGKSSPSPSPSPSPSTTDDKSGLLTSCADFEKLFKESFWRSMNLHKMDALGSNSENSSSDSFTTPSSASSKRSSPSAEEMSPSSRRAAPLAQLNHTVARSMLTTMLQRLIFKIKSKTCNLDQRWPAVSFLIQLVKSFIFSTPIKSLPGPVSSPVTTQPSSTLSIEALLGFELDFPSNFERLHPLSSLPDDIDLLEKSLELLRALRLYQELDPDGMTLQKQREIKTQVEKESHTNKGRTVDINDPSSKLKLNSAHEDLSAVYSNLLPTDQLFLRFLQTQISFLKDSICFLAMMQQFQTNKIASTKGSPFDLKEIHQLVEQFVTMERREKVFCTLKAH